MFVLFVGEIVECVLFLSEAVEVLIVLVDCVGSGGDGICGRMIEEG